MTCRSEALHLLWTGAVRVMPLEGTRSFRRALAALCPVDHVLLEVDAPPRPARVLLDGTEVVPTVSLGDVVAEELHLVVPDGVLLVLVGREAAGDDAPADRRARCLGEAFGEIAVEAVQRGCFAMQDEARIAAALFAAAARRARAGVLGPDVPTAPFEIGLAATIRGTLGGLPLPDPRAADLLSATARRLNGAAPIETPPDFDAWLSALRAAARGRGAPADRLSSPALPRALRGPAQR